MYKERIKYYQELEKARDSKVIAYFTGDRRGLETKIARDVLNLFLEHLDKIGKVKKISLFLYTTGGETIAAWSLVNLIRQFCEELEVIVPSKCQSAGTLICLGANNILMTKQATLGPIDPTYQGPLNPQIPGEDQKVKFGVSVEAISGYIEFAKKEFNIDNSNDLTKVFINLSEKVHPLVIGEVYRARKQIRMLGEKLIKLHNNDEEYINKILDFLCSESGSHDFTIYRREARDVLNLNVENPNGELYEIIKALYDDFSDDLALNTPYNPPVLVGANNEYKYNFKRCLIESKPFGVHSFVSEGTIVKKQIQVQHGIQEIIEDRRTFEGWKYEKP